MSLQIQNLFCRPKTGPEEDQGGHRKDFENERLLVLIAELLNELDKGLILLVEARRWAKQEDALKQGLSPARNVELAEDIKQNLRVSASCGTYEAKGRRQGCKGLAIFSFNPFACPAVHRDVSIRAFHL